MPRVLQDRHHDRAQITLMPGDQYSHSRTSHALSLPGVQRRSNVIGRLLHNEGLRMWAAALHPAKSGQPEKRLLVEPVVARLGRIVLEQQPRLLLGHLGVERVIDRRARSVRFPLEDLVAEHEMVAKLGRQQFGKQPMILMSVIALRTEHHLRVARSAEVAQVILDSFPVCRRPTVRYVENGDLDVGTGTERGQCLRSSASRRCRRRTARVRAHAARTIAGQGQQRAAHPDRDVVAMRTDDRDFGECAGGEWDHRALAAAPRVELSIVLPQHPRSIAAVVSGVELGPFLERVGRLPESVVPIAEQPALARPACRRRPRRDHRREAGRSKISWESTKNPPFSQIGNLETGVMSLTSPVSLTSTQWNDDCGGTIIIEAAAPDLWNFSMMSSNGASVSTSA